MLIRTHSGRYRPGFKRTRFGWRLITKRFIFATGVYARVWS